MTPHIQKLPLCEHSSFVAETFITPHFETPWHYHDEYELVLIIKGNGKRFIGNHISDYEEGNMTFIGSNLPHLFRKDDANAEGGSLVIHFKEAFLGKEFKMIPEMRKINRLLEKSKMGIDITGKTRDQVGMMMYEMVKLQGMERLIYLLRLLNYLADANEYKLLSSPELNSQNAKDSDRLNQVFNYVMAHFQEDIQVHQIAAIVNMSYSGFCRYFKTRTKKTFSQFVNEIRISYACRRLMEGNANISCICYEAGFNNLTNFNNQFKSIIKTTPYQFRSKSKT